jgi:hypothetical protein
MLINDTVQSVLRAHRRRPPSARAWQDVTTAVYGALTDLSFLRCDCERLVLWRIAWRLLAHARLWPAQYAESAPAAWDTDATAPHRWRPRRFVVDNGTGLVIDMDPSGPAGP